MFQNNVIAGASGQGGGFYPKEIGQSLRFNDNDSAYLARTPSTAGNRRTWTWSGWVKRGNLGNDNFLFNNSNDGLRLQTNNTLWVQLYNGTSYSLTTSALFRDVSAWYHIALVVDTTQATASNRVKIYVNGEQVTSFSSSSYPPQNYETEVNRNTAHYLGSLSGVSGYYLDGYLAEVNFIDGQALDADSFGEFKSGVWVPKAYTGTYGTNGFHLDFSNSAAIGDDISGNNNDWTANNLAASDVVLDSPTNNFNVMNALHGDATLSEGNLNVSGTNQTRVGTIEIPQSGKWYFEMCCGPNSPSSNDDGVGLATAPRTVSGYSDYIYRGSGKKQSNSTGYVDYAATYGTGDIIGVVFDADAGSLVFYKNNVSQGTAFTGITERVFANVYARGITSSPNLVANFGQDSSFAGNKTAQGNTDANGIGDFYYSPPAGYLALCTANLPEPAFSPANDESPQDHFNTVLYTGTGASVNNRAISGVGFQPSLTWIKDRTSGSMHHVITDAVRGGGLRLASNLTNADDSSYGMVQTFDTDGFTIGYTSGDNQNVNTLNDAYVAWNWKANGSGVSNTDGSITSTVSANTEAGFSIVSWTATTGSDTIGHGLSQAPELSIVKDRDSTFFWVVYTTLIDGTHDYLVLNATNSASAAGESLPTSSVINVNLGSANDLIAYCFHSVDGFSKFGSYTGNGSTDGPFVALDFEPAFVMIKRTNSASDWLVHDATREPYNVMDNALKPNSSAAEITFTALDTLSNGFKLRNTDGGYNSNGDSYIFMAFARNPLKYSNAR